MLKKIAREALVWLVWLAVGASLSFLLSNFVIVNAHVITASMENTIMTENRVVGLRFLFGEPRRGCIIVFNSPLPDEFTEPFIKRVIGLPGEVVAVTDGVVYIDGMPLIESYVTSPMRRDFAPVTVPDNHLFVMGDNRNISRDSRHFGPIPRADVIARIYFGFSPAPEILANYTYNTNY